MTDRETAADFRPLSCAEATDLAWRAGACCKAVRALRTGGLWGLINHPEAPEWLEWCLDEREYFTSDHPVIERALNVASDNMWWLKWESHDNPHGADTCAVDGYHYLRWLIFAQFRADTEGCFEL